MSLSKEQAARLNRGLDFLLNDLNEKAGPGYTPQDVPYRITTMPERKDIAFGIAFRAPIGQRHPNGQKWLQYVGPSVPDCELIAQTSNTEDEVVQQFRRCIFEGVRPMRLKSGQLMNEDAINQIVNERLKELLDKKIAEITQKQQTQARSETVPETEAPKVSRQREPKLWESDNVDGMRLLEIWTERAKELGLEPPKIAKTGRIDGRWMRNAIEKWQAHQKQGTPA